MSADRLGVTVAAGLSPARLIATLLAAGGLCFSGWTAYGRAAHPAAPQTLHGHELALAQAQLGAAASSLAEAYRMIGTYEQSDLHVFKRLQLVRATDSDYCIQAVEGDGLIYHLSGPGGTVETGFCPR